MYSNFKKEYTLTQHSIMIHFQAEKENSSNNKFVCLRASEVKPKLDRFIVKALGGKDKVKEEFIQAENTNGIDIALKYKLVITRNSDKHIIYRTKLGKNDNPEYELPNIFFANMGDNTVKKYGIFFTDGLKVTVKCFNDELLKIIDEHIGDFFIVTNFGTMQDKGFGSFTVDGKTNGIPNLLMSNYTSGKCYQISDNNIAYNEKVYSNCVQKSIFENIKQVYSIMKSGQNIVGKDGTTITSRYIRSFIYVYMHNKGIGNEKAALKKNGVAPIRNTYLPENQHEHNKCSNITEDNMRYVRSILGIGESIEWLEPKEEEQPNCKPCREKISITYVDTDKEKNDNKDKINRCPSPIFFKIIDKKIYMCANKPNEKMFDRSFNFCNVPKDNNKTSHNNKTSPRIYKDITLKTLTKEQGNNFDMADFLDKFVEYYNNNKNKLFKNNSIK